MQALLSDWYLWIQSIHIVAVITWMAGIFYLPRIFVYHAERAAPGSETSETFKIMERKLFRLIMNPSLIAVWVLGLLLIWANGLDWLAASAWLHAKLVLVVALTWYHHWCGQVRKTFERDENTRSGRHYRVMNEVPILILVAIVILVVVKPF